MQHAFVHLELNTDNVEQARAFYRQVFGWDFNDVPVGDHKYVQIETSKPPGGGIQFKAQRGMPSHWMPYVGVPNVRAVVKKARKAGATVVADYNAIPGYGALAILADPSGACFGVWETAGEVVGEDEAPEVAPIDTPAEETPAVLGGRTGSSVKTKKAAKKKAAKKKTAKKKTAKKKTAKKKSTKKTASAAPVEETAPSTGTKKKTAKKNAAKKTAKKKAAKKKAAKQTAAKKKTAKKKTAKSGRRSGRGRG